MHYCVPVHEVYDDRPALPGISANADLSTALKCLASGRESIPVGGRDIVLPFFRSSYLFMWCKNIRLLLVSDYLELGTLIT